MVRLFAMTKLTCFPVFVRKNKVKNEGHVSVQTKQHIESCQMDSTTCSGMLNVKPQDKSSENTNFGKVVSTEATSLDVAVPSKSPVWSTYANKAVDHKQSKVVDKGMGNIFSAGNCPVGSVANPTNPLDLKSMVELQKNQFKGSGSDCDFSFGPQVGNFSNEVPVDIAYEGGDEDEILCSTRGQSDHDRQRNTENTANSKTITDVNTNISDKLALIEDSGEITFELNKEHDGYPPNEEMPKGHLSDPGDYKMADSHSGSTSPVFQRSCSGSKLETRLLTKSQTGRSPGNCSFGLPPYNSQSFEDLQILAGNQKGIQSSPSSPQSELTFCSADKVMLRRGSSSKVLPSRGRKFWWKIFLLSHRNLHKGLSVKNSGLVKTDGVSEPLNKKEGYSSDTLDVCRTVHQIKKEGQGLAKLKYKKDYSDADLSQQDAPKTVHLNRHIDWEHPSRVSGSWPFNQWVAFSTEQSSLSRVEEWVSTIDTGNSSFDNGDASQEETCYHPEGMAGGSSIVEISDAVGNVDISVQDARFSEEMHLANSAIRSLNAFSTVAHISGIGLSVTPMLAPFSSLRTINLSGNFIVHVTPGSLPRSLHTLNLSRNKITSTEGFRELTRLRVLDLSYNRISRIGHGLVNCTLIKELYLAGNKISDVEGLHRLLKLTVLDLSFNKITTCKALGQLVANYNSLLALDLLGNPVHTNVGDEQLRKSISSLLPHLAYLNKQPIKTVSAREAVVDSVARAALGNSARNSRHKSSWRGSHAPTTHRAGTSIRRGNRNNEGPTRAQGLHRKHLRDKGKSRREHSPSRRASVPLMISEHQKLRNNV